MSVILIATQVTGEHSKGYIQDHPGGSSAAFSGYLFCRGNVCFRQPNPMRSWAVVLIIGHFPIGELINQAYFMARLRERAGHTGKIIDSHRCAADPRRESFARRSACSLELAGAFMLRDIGTEHHEIASKNNLCQRSAANTSASLLTAAISDLPA